MKYNKHINSATDLLPIIYLDSQPCPQYKPLEGKSKMPEFATPERSVDLISEI